FFNLFAQIQEHIPSDLHNELSELKEYLLYYLAHQTRKVYLNAQLNAQLGELNETGALIIVDYKMKILPKSARETKQDFFGKKGWTLHSILIYTRLYNNTTLQPEWVVFISDNGPHYHNADLMLIMGRWKEWYNILLENGLFMKLQNLSIKNLINDLLYITYNTSWRFNIAQGSDIELAIEGIRGTSVAHLEPECSKGKKQVNTLLGNSNWFSWEWPWDDNNTGYVRARAIPNIEIHPDHLTVDQLKTQLTNRGVSYNNESTKQDLISLLNNKLSQELELQKTELSAEALNSNEERGGGKRISKHVITYLEGYFLAGNINKSDRYTAEEMHTELLELVKTGNLEESDVPKVSTIQNWIGRYATQHKQKIALVSQCSIFQ
ncbi:hypothetical protein C2G38_2232810, partial [Gigaspora rosea]